MDEFELQGRTIYKAPHETKHDDGSSSFTLGFPVCEVSEWLRDPEQVLGMLNSYDQLRAQLAEREKTIERLRAVNERDRTQVAIGINAIIEAIRNREWLRLGRGSYEWNDDRWMDEFGHAIDDIQAALNELRKVSLDHSDCPVSREDVLKARAALKEEADDANA